jgi:hypothetical protein
MTVMMSFFGDGCRAIIDDSANGKRAQSSSGEQQCAYRASSALSSATDNSPAFMLTHLEWPADLSVYLPLLLTTIGYHH